MDWTALLQGRPTREEYCGRIAPTPSGLLHIGHAATFLTAAERAARRGGTLLLRIEDIDLARCREEFTWAAVEDLKWLGISWGEGPDCGGPCAPYVQSRRAALHLAAWRRLRDSGRIYPSAASRREIALAASAPHEAGRGEPVFPVSLRPPPGAGLSLPEPGGLNWRFRVPDGDAVVFYDELAGPQRFVAGADFGDFLVWRKDGGPSYEMAVVVDDILMGVTEVVRGADLLLSTARQLLVYEALEAAPPAFAHAPLVLDTAGNRLAKRAGNAVTLRFLRQAGACPRRLFRAGEDGVWRPDSEETGRLAGGGCHGQTGADSAIAG